MKKYIAKQLNNDNYDCDMCYNPYYSEDDAISDNISICGNQNLIGLNAEPIENLIETLLAIGADITEESDPDTEAIADDVLLEIVDDHHLCNRALTNDEKLRIAQLGLDYYETNDNECLVEALGFIYNGPFEYRTIRGSVQREWNGIFYPTREAHLVKYIEAVYFGTGTEYAVTDAPVDLENLDVDTIDFTDCLTYYTTECEESKVKADIAIQLGIMPEELAIATIVDTYMIVKNKYYIN